MKHERKEKRRVDAPKPALPARGVETPAPGHAGAPIVATAAAEGSGAPPNVDYVGPDLAIDARAGLVRDVVLDTWGTTTVSGSLEIAGTLRVESLVRLDGGDVRVYGDVVLPEAPFDGDARLLAGGDHDQLFAAEGGVGALHNLWIVKEQGTLTLRDHLHLSGDLCWVSGEVDARDATIELGGARSRVRAGEMVLHDVIVDLGGPLLVEGDLTVAGDLTVESASAIDGGELLVGGDLLSSCSPVGGAARIRLNGAHDQTLYGGGLPSGTLSIDKPAGRVLLGSNLVLPGERQAVRVSGGLFDLQGHVLAARGGVTVRARGAIRGAGCVHGDLDVAAGGTIVLAVGDPRARGALAVSGRVRLGEGARLGLDVRGIVADGAIAGALTFDACEGELAEVEIFEVPDGLQVDADVERTASGFDVRLKVEPRDGIDRVFATAAGTTLVTGDLSPRGTRTVRIASVSMPRHGRLEHADGASFTYVADAAYSGSDGFGFVAVDAAGTRRQVSVLVVVRARRDERSPERSRASQTVAEGSRVVLSGNATEADGEALTFEWVQLRGPRVALDDASAARPRFTAPSGACELVFELRACDGERVSTITRTVRVAGPGEGASREERLQRPLEVESALEALTRLSELGHGDLDALLGAEAPPPALPAAPAAPAPLPKSAAPHGFRATLARLLGRPRKG